MGPKGVCGGMGCLAKFVRKRQIPKGTRQGGLVYADSGNINSRRLSWVQCEVNSNQHARGGEGGGKLKGEGWSLH